MADDPPPLAPSRDQRDEKEGRDVQDGNQDDGVNERTHLSPSFLPSSTVSSSSSHLTRLPPPLPTRGGGSSSIPSRNNQDGEGKEDTAAVNDDIETAAAAAAEAEATMMPFLLNRGEDGSVPTDDEIVAALSANIDLLASAMRRDGEMTDTYKSDIQEMKQMLSMTEGMLEEADANMDTPPATATAAGGESEGSGVVDTCSNVIAYVDQHRQIAVSSSPSNDEGASALSAPAVRTKASSSSRNQQDAGSDKNATAITGKTPRTSLTPSHLQEAVGISTEGRAAEMANLSDQEKKALFEDLYGRKPDGIEKVETLLLAVDEELDRIPPEEMAMATMIRAREEYPSPFHSSRHILLFLNVEDFDPKRAARVCTRPMQAEAQQLVVVFWASFISSHTPVLAFPSSFSYPPLARYQPQRMVRYWEMRVRYYGGRDRAFSPGTYSLPTDEDQLRIYHKSLATADSTQPIKDAASAFLAKFCDEKLKDLDVQIVQIAAEDHEIAAPYLAYKEAHPHIFDTCHHLGFLQASDYNPAEAANRIVKHWYFYDRLFGSRDADGNLIYIPVTLSNSLNEDCLELLFEGKAVRVMCDEDNHGRGLVYCNIWVLIRSGLSNSDVVSLPSALIIIPYSFESSPSLASFYYVSFP